jgi:hypothetical protein
MSGIRQTVDVAALASDNSPAVATQLQAGWMQKKGEGFFWVLVGFSSFLSTRVSISALIWASSR